MHIVFDACVFTVMFYAVLMNAKTSIVVYENDTIKCIHSYFYVINSSQISNQYLCTVRQVSKIPKNIIQSVGK